MSDRKHPQERKAPVVQEEPRHTKKRAGRGAKPWVIEECVNPNPPAWFRLFHKAPGVWWPSWRRYRMQEDAEKAVRSLRLKGMADYLAYRVVCAPPPDRVLDAGDKTS